MRKTLFGKSKRRKEKALNRAMQCEGWTSVEKLSFLYDKVGEFSGRDVLEIGSAWGRSAVAMASALSDDRKLISIDPHTGGLLYLEKGESQNSYEKFQENLRKFDLEQSVVIHKKTSREAHEENVLADFKFSLAFVDGLHTAQGVRDDWACIVDHLVSGALVVFDDYFQESVVDYKNEIDSLADRYGFHLERDESIGLVWFKYIDKKITTESAGDRGVASILPSGFHGDEYLINLVDSFLSGADVFIETGANVGSTVSFVAKKFPELPCCSCEPDRMSFEAAVDNCKGLVNAKIHNLDSMSFLTDLIKEGGGGFQSPVFWLDAHGYGFDWPLRDEVKFITSNLAAGVILIDDFEVPGITEFGFDVYGDYICNFEFISSVLSDRHDYVKIYPNYTDRTSEFHPLRGWVALVFGEVDCGFAKSRADIYAISRLGKKEEFE